MLFNVLKLIEIWQSIHDNFPDLSEQEDSVQYEWVQSLSDIINSELIQLHSEYNVRNILNSSKLTQDQKEYFIQNWKNNV